MQRYGRAKLGSGLKTIGEKAFFHNHGIESLEIPMATEMIDYAAFAECLGLKRVALGLSAAKLIDNPFLGCAALQLFEVDANNEKYAVENGVLTTRITQRSTFIQTERTTRTLR